MEPSKVNVMVSLYVEKCMFLYVSICGELQFTCKFQDLVHNIKENNTYSKVSNVLINKGNALFQIMRDDFKIEKKKI